MDMKGYLLKIKKCNLNMGILISPIIVVDHLGCLVELSPMDIINMVKYANWRHLLFFWKVSIWYILMY